MALHFFFLALVIVRRRGRYPHANPVIDLPGPPFGSAIINHHHTLLSRREGGKEGPRKKTK